MNMNRILALVAAVLIVAGAGIWWMNRTPSDMSVVNISSTPNAQKAPNAPAADLSLVKTEALGNPKAPVTVIEYASFTCPHCEHWHADVWPTFKKDYVDTGKIRFELREVYFDRFGLWAGMLARCGGSTDRYFAMVDLLYNKQAIWLASRQASGIEAALKKLGSESGLTDKQFTTCMQDKPLAEALVASYQKNATADGVKGTPSFVVDGKLYENMAWTDFKKILDDELAKKAPPSTASKG